jgi:hypothetical protein
MEKTISDSNKMVVADKKIDDGKDKSEDEQVKPEEVQDNPKVQQVKPEEGGHKPEVSILQKPIKPKPKGNKVVTCSTSNTNAEMNKTTILKFVIPNFPTIHMPNFSFLNPIEYIKKKFTFDMKSFKIMIIALLNVLSTPDGKEFFKSLLRALDPTIKIFTDEVIINVRKNKPKLVMLIKELGEPVGQAIRDSLGTIPVFGEAVGAFLALKNSIMAALKGANLISSTVDNFVTIPMSKVLKTTHQALRNASDAKDDANAVNKDIENILKMCNQYHKEMDKIKNAMDRGSSPESLMKKPDIEPEKKMNGGKQRVMLHNSTRRMKRWVKRFSNINSNANANKTRKIVL